MNRLFLAVGVLFALPLRAQAPSASLHVIVTDSVAAPVANAIVQLTPSNAALAVAARTGSDGLARFTALGAGAAQLRVTRLGFATQERPVTLVAGQTVTVRVRLVAEAQRMTSLRVVALPPDLVPEREVDRTRIAASVPHDASAVLRELPGTDAMRRGALGLDPVVRGLRDTQLGVYVDAARTLPGGPAGMDTPMSHVDPAHVERIEVISGPYALTWGAGNLSAIRVSTQALPDRAAGALQSSLTSGYDGNLDASEYSGAVRGALGATGRLRYSTSGAYRQGGDYRDGNDAVIASRFRSYEGRTRVGVALTDRSELSVLGSYQAQRDVDYPGRPLDAAFFNTYQVQGEYAWRADGAGRLRALDAMAYVYDVDHLMDNDAKPTALPDPTRTPPFATDIETQSGVRVLGGRVAGVVSAGVWRLELGGDVMDADHDASRTVERRDTGMPMREDLIWGGARIQTLGAFARGERAIGATTLGLAMRVDAVRADADTVSPFFATEYGTDVASDEVNVSGAATWRVPLSVRWTTTVGLGSVVRTAEANERFSDRAAAKRAQTNAEFLGDPNLKPERSTQADVWLEGRFGRAALQVNAFARQMDDYITIAPTALPTAQPASPPPVYRYINGEARYFGGEVLMSVVATPALTVGASTSYLYGDDVTLDEPALGVTPLRSTLMTLVAPLGSSWFAEGQVTVAGAQTRVATTRGELATPGWTTVDLQAGYRPSSPALRGLELRAGVRNLLDRPFVQHLSARNAFGGGRLYEPGRVLFVRVSVGS